MFVVKEKTNNRTLCQKANLEFDFSCLDSDPGIKFFAYAENSEDFCSKIKIFPTLDGNMDLNMDNVLPDEYLMTLIPESEQVNSL